jgi:hypothetical protein
MITDICSHMLFCRQISQLGVVKTEKEAMVVDDGGRSGMCVQHA